MKPKSLPITAIIALLLPSPGYSKVITQIEMPVATTVILPCAAGGAGELVALTGEVHAVFAVTQDGSGGVHTTTHFNYVGVTGIGLTTGDEYHASGGNSFVSNAGGMENEFTFVNDFLMTAAGAGNNLHIHETVHVTVDANGEVTADISNITVDCG